MAADSTMADKFRPVNWNADAGAIDFLKICSYSQPELDGHTWFDHHLAR